MASSLVFMFYLAGYLLPDVYRYPFLGAVYELLWLPMLLSLVAIPVMCVVLFTRKDARLKWYAALSLTIIMGALLILINHQ